MADISKTRAVLTVAATGLLCAACLIVTQPASAATSDEGKTTEYEWSIDLDCSTCHEAQYASLGLNADGTAADGSDAAGVQEASEPSEKTQASENASDAAVTSGDDASETTDDAQLEAVNAYGMMHAQSLGLTCTTCHEDTDGLAKGHKKLNSGKEATRLKKSEVSSEVCLTCHDKDDLAEATADCTVLTDTNGTVVNPHDLPEVEDHEGITCTDCHAVHDTEEGVAETAYATCVNCHHAEVFECGTCH